MEARVVFPLHYFLAFIAGVIEEMSERCEKTWDANPERLSLSSQLHSIQSFSTTGGILTGHTYHMNQFFLVWPTWATQTPCVCTWSKGVFCFRKKPQHEAWNNQPIHPIFTSVCCFKDLSCRTEDGGQMKMSSITYKLDQLHSDRKELSSVEENGCWTGSPWQQVFLLSNEFYFSSTCLRNR